MKYEDRAIHTNEVKEEEYHFPKHRLTVKAKNLSEALVKAEELLKNKNTTT